MISIWYFWQCNHKTGEFYEDFKISKKLQKESLLLAPLFKMMEAIFDLLVPLVVARIIDDGIRRGDTTYVLQMGVCCY